MRQLLDKLLGRAQLRKDLAVACARRDYFASELESLKWRTGVTDSPTSSMINNTLAAMQAEAQYLRKQLNEQTARANSWKFIATKAGKNHEQI